MIFEWINWHFQKILYYFETILAGFCQNKLHDDLPCSNNNYGDTSSYLYICSLKAFSFFILKKIIAQIAIEDNCKRPLWFVFNFFLNSCLTSSSRTHEHGHSLMSSESDRGCPTVVNLNIISMKKNFVHSFYIFLMLSDPPDCSYDLLHLNVLYMYIYVFSFKSFFSCLYRVCSFVMILYHTFLYVLLTICFYVKSLYLFLF